MTLGEEDRLKKTVFLCLENVSEPNDITIKRVSGNIHRQSGRHFDVENLRSSNPTAFVW